jgi:hypothetical protein
MCLFSLLCLVVLGVIGTKAVYSRFFMLGDESKSNIFFRELLLKLEFALINFGGYFSFYNYCCILWLLYFAFFKYSSLNLFSYKYSSFNGD